MPKENPAPGDYFFPSGATKASNLKIHTKLIRFDKKCAK